MKEVKKRNVINYVAPQSIAEELGIEVGDILLGINGQPIEDIIEYKFYLADEYLEVEIEKPHGEQWILEVEKEYDEDLGIDFENPILCHMRSCQNKCIFCFVDQLPPNMRESLYFKDDDSRLSFLHGNYITLTNMKEKDIEKIIQYRISPINVSVHTTNGELRKRMLNNRFAGNILEILKKLADHEIKMNCQIVLCPGVNDGVELDRTLADLGELSDAIQSTAVVPVGLTRYREKLPKVEAFTQQTALATVKQVMGWQRTFQKRLHRSFVHLSDEFYLTASVPFPAYKSYEGFPQLENGVGMVVKFRQEFLKALEKGPLTLAGPRKITVVTGTLASGLMNYLCKEVEARVPGLAVQVLTVENQFFGGHVSVSGLLTGQDIRDALLKFPRGEKIIIGENMLKSGEPVFLDDMTLDALEAQMAVPIAVSPVTGEGFLKALLG